MCFLPNGVGVENKVGKQETNLPLKNMTRLKFHVYLSPILEGVH